jgi:ferritin-like metal-binding protein YciE
MRVDSLRKLYIEELQDIYDAENQIVNALQNMIKSASSSSLKKAFNDHLEITRIQIARLKDIFNAKNEKPTGKECKGIKGIISENMEMVKSIKDSEVLDAALIACAQRVEHYEISAYGTVRTYADILGDEDAKDLLQSTLDEEKETDLKLTSLAMSSINIEAVK